MPGTRTPSASCIGDADRIEVRTTTTPVVVDPIR
jgi:hypothetical protein